MLAIFFVGSSFTKHSDPDLRTKEVNVIIRQIGHRLLLQAGDSTSRVLPVTEIKKGTFLLKFENAFVFNHDSLMVLSQGLLPKTQFPSGYTVTVHDCNTADIVYGFQVNTTEPDILACRGRRQPSGCYTIEFAFADFYESVEQKKADINQLTEELKSIKEDLQEANSKLERAEELKSFKVNPQEVNPIPPDSYREAIGTEKSKTTTFDYDIDPLTEELKSFKVDPQEVNPTPPDSYREAIGTEEFTTTSNYPLINLVSVGMVVVLVVTLLIVRFRKILTPAAPVQNQSHAITKESVPQGSALGKFLFDVKNQRLLPSAPDSHREGMGSKVTSLTDKECKILELLYKNFGELIPRETLMQEVWINEGVITGRSLDMFVSKLRKKLSSDPDLRITNVHGKGYKLEIPGI
jgi:hypothetical protein